MRNGVLTFAVQHTMSHKAIREWRARDPVFAQMEEDCMAYLTCNHYWKLLMVGDKISGDEYHAILGKLRVPFEDIMARLEAMKDEPKNQDTALFCARMMGSSLKPDPSHGPWNGDLFKLTLHNPLKEIHVRVRHLTYENCPLK